MFPEKLKKLIEFSRLSGEKVIVFDSEFPDNPFVIVDFDVYASSFSGQKGREVSVSVATKETVENRDNEPKIVSEKSEESSINTAKISKNENLTEEDLTDKINREISLWKNQGNIPDAEDEKSRKGWQIPTKIKSKAPDIAN